MNDETYKVLYFQINLGRKSVFKNVFSAIFCFKNDCTVQIKLVMVKLKALK